MRGSEHHHRDPVFHWKASSRHSDSRLSFGCPQPLPAPDMGISSYLKTQVINSRPGQLSGFCFPCFTSLGGVSAPGLGSTLLTSWPFSFSSGSWWRKWAAQKGASLNSETDSRGCPQTGTSFLSSWSLLQSCPFLLISSGLWIPHPGIRPLTAFIDNSHDPWSTSCLFSDLRVFRLCNPWYTTSPGFGRPLPPSRGFSWCLRGALRALCLWECALSRSCPPLPVQFYLPSFSLVSPLGLWPSSFRFDPALSPVHVRVGPPFQKVLCLPLNVAFKSVPHPPTCPHIPLVSSLRLNPTPSAHLRTTWPLLLSSIDRGYGHHSPVH